MQHKDQYIELNKDKVIAECRYGWKLSLEQIIAILVARLRKDNAFSTLPIDFIRLICKRIYAPDINIATLLHHVSYGNPDVVQAVLHFNPFLLDQSGDVDDPAGNSIYGVTPYECSIGAGDDGMSELIARHFDRINDGAKKRWQQISNILMVYITCIHKKLIMILKII